MERIPYLLIGPTSQRMFAPKTERLSPVDGWENPNGLPPTFIPNGFT